MPVNFTVPSTTKDRTHLVIAIDSSGSMYPFTRQVVDQFNSQIETLRNSARELDQSIWVSALTFGGVTTSLLFPLTPIENIPKMEYEAFVAASNTPLFLGGNHAIEILQREDGPNVANLVTILTDGEENASGYDAKQRFAVSVRELQLTDRWTFVFSVPRGYKDKLVRSFAIHPGNVQEWDQTEAGFEQASSATQSSYATYLSDRSRGVMRSTSFYTVGVDQEAARKAKKSLKDVRNEFLDLKVTTQSPKVLQPFVESHGLTFRKGSSFYQLTKTELVQHHKEVLLKELSTGKVYGGADARSILGLPRRMDTKVRPQDHSDWEIFVQSTSNNRKLQVGTSLLYLRS